MRPAGMENTTSAYKNTISPLEMMPWRSKSASKAKAKGIGLKEVQAVPKLSACKKSDYSAVDNIIRTYTIH